MFTRWFYRVHESNRDYLVSKWIHQESPFLARCLKKETFAATVINSERSRDRFAVANNNSTLLLMVKSTVNDAKTSLM